MTSIDQISYLQRDSESLLEGSSPEPLRAVQRMPFLTGEVKLAVEIQLVPG